MNRTTTPSFCLTLSLRYEPWQRDKLDKIFKVAGFVYNNLVADRKKALRKMEQSPAWKNVSSELKDLYQEIGKQRPSNTQKAQKAELLNKRKNLLMQYGINEFAFQSRAKKWGKHYQNLLGSTVVQKIASAVWEKFESYFYKDGKEIRFQSWQQVLSIEGKKNTANIRYTNGSLHIGKTIIPVVPATNGYEREALKHRVKFCRIIRMPWKNGAPTGDGRKRPCKDIS